MVHHLYSYSFIMQKILYDLNIPVKDYVYNYTKEELDLIKNKCVELHNKYGLGLCLCNSVHRLFHSVYGQRNNTPEQFGEFCQRYYTGEFNNMN